MKVLIVNDEGALTDGTIALAKVLATKHQVIVVAPEGKVKGAGASYTSVKKIVKVKRFGFFKNFKLFTVNGTPCDCLSIALEHIVKSKPDVVISGIDFEHNKGVGSFSSGNLNVAIMGALNGIPSICISTKVNSSNDTESDYYPTARLLRANLEKWVKLCKPGIALNINVPHKFKAKKVMWTVLVDGVITNVYEKSIVGEDVEVFWLKPPVNGYPIWVLEQKADLSYLKKGYITITPIKTNLTDYKFNKKLEEINWQL